MQGQNVQSYRDLIVWQKAMNVVDFVYAVTKTFPREELFGLTSQMRRCAVSLPSNIAEGKHRSTHKEYAQFLSVAYASSMELETQLEIAQRQNMIVRSEYEKICAELTEVQKMLNVLIRKIRSKS